MNKTAMNKIVSFGKTTRLVFGRGHKLFLLGLMAFGLAFLANVSHADPLRTNNASTQAATVQPATAESITAVPQTLALPTAYVIAPGDQLTILVLGHDDLRADVTVLPDGSFTVPVAGTIRAAGLTISQLTHSLLQAYSYELNQPRVTVVIRQAQQPQVSVLGTVKLPGQFTYKSGMHLLDALAAAGGPNQDMAQTYITLVSVTTSTSRRFAAGSLIGDSVSSENISLQPGDVLLVEQADPAATQVQVNGEVIHPGFYPVPTTGTSLQTLINAAGGYTTSAAQAHTQVEHGMVSSELRSASNQLSASSDSSLDTMIYPGDTVSVPTNQRKIAVIGEVHLPGSFLIPDGSTMTVTSAVILAGGTTTEADKMRADILRRTPDGKAKAIPVNIASILKGDPSAPDLVLQSGDILYLPTHSPRGADSSSLLSILPGFAFLLR